MAPKRFLNESSSSVSVSVSHSQQLSLLPPPSRTCDVFLSFRGEDTRNNFVGHLYKALDRYGIYTFKDDLKLKKGKTVAPELLKSIEESRYSIVILSENYATSAWCLDELVKIIHCMDQFGQIVVPIFYNVDPSDVQKQTGRFKRAFDNHERAFKKEKNKVLQWREALRRVGSISGADSRNSPLFVTWKKVAIGGEPRLRGCIGTLEPRGLINGFKDYALTSALRDRRFPPIQAKELPSLECTVSILVDYETANNYLDWEVGKHGIIIEFTDPSYNSRRSATYLPEVAAHEGWTKLEAIDSLMCKSGYNGAITESLRKRIKLIRYQSTLFTMLYSEYVTYVKATRGSPPATVATAKSGNC